MRAASKTQHVCYHQGTATSHTFFCVTFTLKVSCSDSPWEKCRQCVREQYPFHISRSCRHDLVRHPRCMVWPSSAAPGSAKGVGAVCGEELMFTMKKTCSLHWDSVPISFLLEHHCSALLGRRGAVKDSRHMVHDLIFGPLVRHITRHIIGWIIWWLNLHHHVCWHESWMWRSWPFLVFGIQNWGSWRARPWTRVWGVCGRWR